MTGPIVVATSGWRMHEDIHFIETNMWRTTEHLFSLGFEVFYRVGDNKGKNGKPGADVIVQGWLTRNFPDMHQVYEATWDKLGNYAGPDRNKNMLEGTRDPYGLAHLLLAFPEPGVYRYRDSGTWGCMKEAFRKGVRVETPAYKIWESDESKD